jgi:hypothetical protein
MAQVVSKFFFRDEFSDCVFFKTMKQSMKNSRFWGFLFNIVHHFYKKNCQKYRRMLGYNLDKGH